ncbi:hypothetical protein SL1157_2821 [Ruegeria lacuscaerulensis ITI-1157]|nr:hypothetical protein SL1157_2821 [Ruegeria lacuscaerulensis ITI-1157]
MFDLRVLAPLSDGGLRCLMVMMDMGGASWCNGRLLSVLR